MKKIIILFIIFTIALSVNSCYFSNDSNDLHSPGMILKVKIICTGGSFIGYYIVDVGSPEPFSVTLSTNGYYIYEKEINDINNLIEITASVIDSADATLYIKIYKNNILDYEEIKDVFQGSSDRSLKVQYFIN